MKNNQEDFISGIGNTPLIKLRAASEITGCNIYGKAEFLNPGGSVKDRAALALIKDAQQKKLISIMVHYLLVKKQLLLTEINALAQIISCLQKVLVVIQVDCL